VLVYAAGALVDTGLTTAEVEYAGGAAAEVVTAAADEYSVGVGALPVGA
jgi:2-keto-3-deoxy-6-phosphogluconate aldolase